MMLTDDWDNQPQGAEALYVDRLVLMPDARLDLNGLRLYYLELEDRGGTVITDGGSFEQVRVPLVPGDANQDRRFDQLDLVQGWSRPIPDG